MPRIKPINQGRDVVGASSLGRQRINAPIEAFDEGRGLQRLGQGVQRLGAGVQQYGRNAEVAARRDEVATRRDKAQAESDLEDQRKLKRDRAMLNYSQKMNFYLQENKDRLDHEKNLGEYDKFRSAARQKAMEEYGETDANELEKFSITLDRSTLGYDMTMQGSAQKIRKAEENAIRVTRLGEEKKKLLNSTGELETWALYGTTEGKSNTMDWFQKMGAGFIDSMNSIAEQAPNEELQAAARNQMLQDLGTDVVGVMSDRIADHEVPQEYTDIVKSVVADLYAGNVFDKTQRNAANKMIDNKLKARATADDNRNKAFSRESTDSVIDALIDADTNPGEQDIIVSEFEKRQGDRANSLDPTGVKSTQEVKAFLNTKNGVRSTINKNKILELFLENDDPLVAREALKSMEKGNKYTDPEGKERWVPDIDKKDASYLRQLLKKDINVKAKAAAKRAIKDLKKLSEDGKLYWHQYEAKPRRKSTTDLILEGNLIGAALEPLRDVEFEPLDVEVGESASVFERGIPFASDWDQHQIEGEDLSKLAEKIMELAISQEVIDDEVMNKKIAELLTPSKLSAARLRVDQRMRLLAPQAKEARETILNGVR